MFPEAIESVLADRLDGDFIATIYRGSDQADTNLATSFKREWSDQGSSDYEIEMFPLPSNWNDQAFIPFLRSDHYNFWSNQIPAIFLTDTGKSQ